MTEFQSEEIIFQFGYHTTNADMFKGTTGDGKAWFWTEFYNVFNNVDDDLAPEDADEPTAPKERENFVGLPAKVDEWFARLEK